MTKSYSWIRVTFGFQSTDARIGHVKRMITVLPFLLLSCILFGVKSALLSISFQNICSSAIHLSLWFTCCDKIIHLDSIVIPWTEWKSSVLNLFFFFSDFSFPCCSNTWRTLAPMDNLMEVASRSVKLLSLKKVSALYYKTSLSWQF